MQKNNQQHYLVCIKNEGYPTSLELRKIYNSILDAKASEHHLVRVIDESGEDYLYPSGYFIPIELPEEVSNVLSTVP